MYQIQPKRENKIAYALLLVLVVLAIVLVAVSAVVNAFAGILQLFAVILFACDVMVFVRYFKKDYVYRLQGFNTAEQAPDFIVSEVSGKNSIMLCRLSLCELVAIRKREEKAENKSAKKYNYCVDIAPKGAYCFDFLDRGERVTVIITPDEKMLSIFEEFLQKNQAENEN